LQLFLSKDSAVDKRILYGVQSMLVGNNVMALHVHLSTFMRFVASFAHL